MRAVSLRIILLACLCTLFAKGAVARKGWYVAPCNGAPCLWHDGKPVPPFFVMFCHEFDREMPELARRGFHSYSVGDIRKALTLDPEAVILPRIYFTDTAEWCAANPEECFKPEFPPKREMPNTFLWRMPRKSFASVRFREDFAETFREKVRSSLRDGGSHLVGINFAEGPWAEHYHWDALPMPATMDEAIFGDRSESMRRWFCKYLRRKYGNDVTRLRKAWKDSDVTFDTVQIPFAAERLKMDEEGAWRDPAKGRKVPDFFEAYHVSTACLIDWEAGIVKQASSNNLATIAFYGYTQEHMEWPVECDHRAPSWAYRSPSTDVFVSPHTYNRRRPGEDGGMRQHLASAALHGKLFIDEGDDMTCTIRARRSDPRRHTDDRDESVHLLYREFGQAITHGVGLWWMDLRGGNFDDPLFLDAIGRMGRWAEMSLDFPRGHFSEVALVSHPESEFYMPYRPLEGTNGVCRRLYESLGEFYRAGAPFDWYLADDLEAVAARKDVKVVVLLDCQYLSDGQSEIVRRMRTGGRKVVFCHAPGYVSQNGLSWDRVRRITGGPLYRNPWIPTAAALRKIYHEAGVHIYTETDDAVLSVNASWGMIHVRTPGEYVLRLPRKRHVIDMVEDRDFGVTDSFSVHLEGKRTMIFRMTE